MLRDLPVGKNIDHALLGGQLRRADRRLNTGFETNRKHNRLPPTGGAPSVDKAFAIKAGVGLAQNFPGPMTLHPSGAKWRWLALASGCVTVMSIYLGGLRGDIGLLLATIFFGIGTAVSVTTLLPGASSLRLHETGFDVTKFFWTKTFNWSDVSDFRVWTYKRANIVVFKVAKPEVGFLNKVTTALSGRISGLPDTYGLDADELVHLMTAWRNLALNTSKQSAVTAV